MLDGVLDIFRLRQYFDVVVRSRQLAEGVRRDASFLDLTRRSVLETPFDRRHTTDRHPFPPKQVTPLPELDGRRVALVSTGGSGALASIVGAARAFEEHGIRPSVISVCSGSALFGFPLAAGLSSDQVAFFVGGLRPADYVDVDWLRLLMVLPSRGRGFAGVLRGDRLEHTYRRLLGDMRLRDLVIPAYAPIWNVEHNVVDFVGPATHPDLPVARAVRMAVALPLFYDPVPLDGGYWCDGGIVDIFPVRPVLDLEPASDAAVAVNGFYPPGFSGEDVTGWHDQTLSILEMAAQVRTCQQAQLARDHLEQLRRAMPVELIEPVPYTVVQGIGFYRQFLDTSDWPGFMRAGRSAAVAAIDRLGVTARASTPPSSPPSPPPSPSGHPRRAPRTRAAPAGR